MLLDGKKLLVTGVLTKDSIAAAVARLAQEQGAELVLTSFGRGMRLTERVARTLPVPPDVVELDITDAAQHEALARELGTRWGKVDGALHAVGFAPEACLGQPDGVMAAEWDDVATALHVSAYSLKSLTKTLLPLMPDGGSVVGLDFDAALAWPAYDWMGVAKAALEATNRYVARDVGAQRVRVNLVAAGPLRTLAARSIPDFAAMEDAWTKRAPLGWDVRDPEPVARACVALLSDWFPATTGEIIHVDGGAHMIALSHNEAQAALDALAAAQADRSAATSPGTATPGTATPGTATPGTATPGTVTSGSPDAATPGTATPGTATPGTATPGTATPGTATPGTGTGDR